MNKKHEFTQEEIEEIRAARKENTDERIERRLKALRMKAEGATSRSVVEATGYYYTYVSALVKKYKHGGIVAVAENHRKGGNRRNISVEEEKKLLEEFITETKEGLSVDIAGFKKAYIEKVGHSIGGSQIYYVLKRHGLSAKSRRKDLSGEARQDT